MSHFAWRLFCTVNDLAEAICCGVGLLCLEVLRCNVYALPGIPSAHCADLLGGIHGLCTCSLEAFLHKSDDLHQIESCWLFKSKVIQLLTMACQHCSHSFRFACWFIYSDPVHDKKFTIPCLTEIATYSLYVSGISV